MHHHPWLKLPSCFCLILVLLCPCLASALSACVSRPCEASAPPDGEGDLLSLIPSGSLVLIFQRDPTRKMLVALQATDGKVRWQHSTQSANVILADGSLYASYSGYAGTSCYAARDSELEKFQPGTDSRLWRFQLAA